MVSGSLGLDEKVRKFVMNLDILNQLETCGHVTGDDSKEEMISQRIGSVQDIPSTCRRTLDCEIFSL